jgi:hypothetical protein
MDGWFGRRRWRLMTWRNCLGVCRSAAPSKDRRLEKA